MINVLFYNFSKKENSTLRPSEPGTAMLVALKDNCSVVNPVFELSFTAAYLPTFNYCYCEEFSRYYYINDWSYSAGVWIASCYTDPLASFKEQIEGSSFYVVRSTRLAEDNTIVFNGNISDTTYPVTAGKPTYSASAISNLFSGVDGVYVAGIVNNQTRNGGVSYYAFNALGFRNFVSALFNYSTGWLNIDVSEISENLQKALVNPFQYVVSCMYLPINVSDVTDWGEVVQEIRFGWWSIPLTFAARIVPTTCYVSKSVSLTIPRHPQRSRGNYLNLSPYSYYTLRFHPFGTINIDSEAISEYSTLDLYVSLDICTGRGILNVCTNGFSNPIRTIEADCGIQIPTAAVQVNYMNMGKGSAVAAGAAAINQLGAGSGSFFQNVSAKISDFLQTPINEVPQKLSGAAGAINNIASAAVSASATVEITGSQGCASGYNTQTLTLSGRFLPVAAEDFEHRGRPLCEVRQLSTLKGFIQCSDADINAPCTERERAAINAALNGGFYLE